MSSISNPLAKALDSDCLLDICQVINRKNPDELSTMKSMVKLDKSVDPRRRQKSIYALGRWGDESAATPILNVLPKLEESERITAIDSLGRLKAVEAVDQIIGNAENESLIVRKTVVRALGRIRTDKAKKELEKIKETDPSPYIRNLAGMRLKKCHKEKNGEE